MKPIIDRCLSGTYLGTFWPLEQCFWCSAGSEGTLCKRGPINIGSQLGTNYGRSGASLRSSRDLIVCTDPDIDRCKSNPGSSLIFESKKWSKGTKKKYCRCRWSRFGIVSGSSFRPIDMKIRANDADGSNYSESSVSDPLAQGVVTPLQGGCNIL